MAFSYKLYQPPAVAARPVSCYLPLHNLLVTYVRSKFCLVSVFWGGTHLLLSNLEAIPLTPILTLSVDKFVSMGTRIVTRFFCRMQSMPKKAVPPKITLFFVCRPTNEIQKNRIRIASSGEKIVIFSCRIASWCPMRIGELTSWKTQLAISWRVCVRPKKCLFEHLQTFSNDNSC